MKLLRKLPIGIGFVCALLAGSIHASVTIGGTRVVYPLEQREVTVKLDNDSNKPSLVQVWIDDGKPDAKPGEIKVPFVITPPIFRMDAKKAQTLRVMYTGEPLPQDRESVYWLNVLDIPPKAGAVPDANTLSLAYRTRIKVFARPDKLPGKPEDAAAQLRWSITASADGKGQAVSVSNPTPYYVSFSEIGVESGGHTFRNDQGGMVAPRTSAALPIAKMNGVAAGAKVHYIAINDYGGPIDGDAALGD
ncbi:P pilus assembly protein, chaperone PapD [Burkholderia sp. Ch1-1]|uniref:Periplasmic pilin chaperone n=1 Tax=Paraburkholderia dioscoreae TaxID=2604047 RepID=A0A5Q4ZRE6_9BURK|nr:MULTISPECIES: fimbria/pilus periplasmic chaperone [Paraburkholderia]EIF35487.1 P pilus assembly protein, chaperone PapD [Burkholderia sp. Ch1-1]MDR8397366.1 fimbria/pilus periplasmic chaperone [Paraburkholderia sp. USG1]VVD31380.1 periplasmic pilin chaperone [Paraburkholderia dioscoreae]